MDRQPSGLRFGAIGHQDNWQNVERFVNAIRELNNGSKLSVEQIREVFGYIPPRPLFSVEMFSTITGLCQGSYIETFIPPDELNAKHLKANLARVIDACNKAAEMGLAVVSLGGFTSIVLEANGYELQRIGNTFFTTGNSLTAGFIVQSVEAAVALQYRVLSDLNLLVVGSTGDIGSGCVDYFRQRVKKLLLCARNPSRLRRQAEKLQGAGTDTSWSVEMNSLLPEADIVIFVTSDSCMEIDFKLMKPTALICDAGYPKNLLSHEAEADQLVFAGGMGCLSFPFQFDPPYAHSLYQFPLANVVHGCLLEAIVLAMDNKPCSYSVGRGNITEADIVRILEIAAKHGVYRAPLFNSNGKIEIPSAYGRTEHAAGTTVEVNIHA